jgi:hypothetical protein
VTDNSPQKKGGLERARKLTGTAKSAIARSGAAARWDSSIPTALLDGELPIGEINIECAVLPDGTRLLSERALTRGFGGKRGGAHWRRKRAGDDGADLPVFLSAKNISSNLPSDLLKALTKPILYRTGAGGRIAHGVEASLLPRICRALMDLQRRGLLLPSQEPIAMQAGILFEGFAEVGIIALVDAATGYEKVRARDELQKILAAYIAPELLPWAKRFPDSYYEHLYRVRGWEYKPGSNARTAYIGKLTNALIYQQLPTGVIDELRARNPRDPVTKRRKHTHHELLTSDVGHPHLDRQIISVTTLLSVSDDWSEFSRLFSKKFPPGPGDLFALPVPGK